MEFLDKVEEIKRFRFSSIEPNLLSDDIIRLIAKSEKFVTHFHILFQSRSNKILRRSFRELYAEKIEKIKYFLQQVSIVTSVIVGFPGERSKNFMKTFYFLNEIKVSYFHVRENISVFRIHGIFFKRNKVLLSLSEIKRYKFYASQIGTKNTVILEYENIKGFLYGFTVKNIITNSLQNVKLKKKYKLKDFVAENKYYQQICQ